MNRRALLTVLQVILFVSGMAWGESPARPRARDLGIAPGVFAPGTWNAITDVAGVMVGQVTLIQGEDIRTGVTAIVPHAGNLFQEKVPASIVVGNAFGKLVGSTQVNELGQLETPILLTNTLNVWEAAAALVDYTLAEPGNEDVVSVNPVVGETNDGWLNDIRRRALGREHFLAALRKASTGPVEEGSVGAGTGTRAFGGGPRRIKGGIGTSSRRLSDSRGGYTVGVLVQTNFGGALTMDGVPIGKELGLYPYQDEDANAPRPSGDSCMIVVATDAPLDARELRRLGWRAFAGMARSGSSFEPGSGDYVIAFSTAESLRIKPGDGHPVTATLLRDDDLAPLFKAVAEATEEAIYNSVLRATTIRGRAGHEVQALAIDAVQQILRKYKRGK